MAASKIDIDFCKKFAGFLSRQNCDFAKSDLVLVTTRMGHILKIYTKFEVNQFEKHHFEKNAFKVLCTTFFNIFFLNVA